MTDNNYYDSSIDFIDLFKALWKKKYSIFFTTSLAALTSIIISLSLPNIYKSSSLLAPSSTNENLNSQLSSFSSVASLVGVNIPSGEITKSQEAIERIKSFNFFVNDFLPNIKLENLMAFDKWIPENNIIIYDDDLFDIEKNLWIRDVSYPKKIIPSNLEAFDEYKKILNIHIDQSSAFVTISLNHKSPIIAKNWLDLIIKNINESMREIDIQNAKNSINYLNDYYTKTNIQSLKESVSNLQESQMQTLMVAYSNSDYIFKVIDPPIISEKKFKPNRAMICIVGTLLGFLIAIIFILVSHYTRKE